MIATGSTKLLVKKTRRLPVSRSQNEIRLKCWGYSLYHFHTHLNRNRSLDLSRPRDAGHRILNMIPSRPSDSDGGPDGQVQPRSSRALEESAAARERSCGAPADTNGVAARRRQDAAGDCRTNGSVFEHSEPGAHGI